MQDHGMGCQSCWDTPQQHPGNLFPLGWEHRTIPEGVSGVGIPLDSPGPGSQQCRLPIKSIYGPTSRDETPESWPCSRLTLAALTPCPTGFFQLEIYCPALFLGIFGCRAALSPFPPEHPGI